MAYEPTQWRSGDTITSERLNKMEQGIASGGSGEFYALNTTQIAVDDNGNEVADGEEGSLGYRSVDPSSYDREGIPMWLFVSNYNMDETAPIQVCRLESYNDVYYFYMNSSIQTYLIRSNGKFSETMPGLE